MTIEVKLPEVDPAATHIDETTPRLYAVTVDNRVAPDGTDHNVSLYLHYWKSIEDLRARKLSTQKYWLTRGDMLNYCLVMQDEASVIRDRNGTIIPPDSLDFYRPTNDEMSKGDAAAKSLVEHCKRCNAAACEKVVSDAGGEWVVSVEWKPTGKVN